MARSTFVHEGVTGSGVGVELMWLLQPGQLSVDLRHIGLVRVCVLRAEQTEECTADPLAAIERRLACAPRHHEVSSVEDDRGTQFGHVGCHEICDTSAHAKPCDADSIR